MKKKDEFKGRYQSLRDEYFRLLKENKRLRREVATIRKHAGKIDEFVEMKEHEAAQEKESFIDKLEQKKEKAVCPACGGSRVKFSDLRFVSYNWCEDCKHRFNVKKNKGGAKTG